MKTTLSSLAAAGALLWAGCATSHTTASMPERAARAAGSGVAYNDQVIAMIKRGVTTESQLLEWFGAPESRALKSDGSSQLAWHLGTTESGQAGTGSLIVSLAADGKVDAYSAHGQPLPSKMGLAGAPSGGAHYDDEHIALIKRGATTEAQLLEWFGPPESRIAKSDGSGDLNWSLAAKTDGAATRAGVLRVTLAADGNVDSYSAHRELRLPGEMKP